MIDRGSVIEALEQAIPFMRVKGYGAVALIMHDALELLKVQEPVKPTQEPRLLSLSEVYKEKGLFWLETKAPYTRDHKPKLCRAVFNGEDKDRTMEFFCQGVPRPERLWHVSAGYYGVSIRCWTEKPTEAQREEEPWND